MVSSELRCLHKGNISSLYLANIENFKLKQTVQMQNFLGLLSSVSLKLFIAHSQIPQLFSHAYTSLCCGGLPRNHQNNSMPKKIQAAAWH